jgi:hypothetical protein
MADQQLTLTPQQMDEWFRHQNALLQQQRDTLRRIEQAYQEQQHFLVYGQRRSQKSLLELVGQTFIDSFVEIGKGLWRITLETIELALDRLCEQRRKQRGG